MSIEKESEEKKYPNPINLILSEVQLPSPSEYSNGRELDEKKILGLLRSSAKSATTIPSILVRKRNFFWGCTWYICSLDSTGNSVIKENVDSIPEVKTLIQNRGYKDFKHATENTALKNSLIKATRNYLYQKFSLNTANFLIDCTDDSLGKYVVTYRLFSDLFDEISHNKQLLKSIRTLGISALEQHIENVMEKTWNEYFKSASQLYGNQVLNQLLQDVGKKIEQQKKKNNISDFQVAKRKHLYLIFQTVLSAKFDLYTQKNYTITNFDIYDSQTKVEQKPRSNPNNKGKEKEKHSKAKEKEKYPIESHSSESTERLKQLLNQIKQKPLKYADHKNPRVHYTKRSYWQWLKNLFGDHFSNHNVDSQNAEIIKNYQHAVKYYANKNITPKKKEDILRWRFGDEKTIKPPVGLTQKNYIEHLKTLASEITFIGKAWRLNDKDGNLVTESAEFYLSYGCFPDRKNYLTEQEFYQAVSEYLKLQISATCLAHQHCDRDFVVALRLDDIPEKYQLELINQLKSLAKNKDFYDEIIEKNPHFGGFILHSNRKKLLNNPPLTGYNFPIVIAKGMDIHSTQTEGLDTYILCPIQSQPLQDSSREKAVSQKSVLSGETTEEQLTRESAFLLTRLFGNENKTHLMNTKNQLIPQASVDGFLEPLFSDKNDKEHRYLQNPAREKIAVINRKILQQPLSSEFLAALQSYDEVYITKNFEDNETFEASSYLKNLDPDEISTVRIKFSALGYQDQSKINDHLKNAQKPTSKELFIKIKEKFLAEVNEEPDKIQQPKFIDFSAGNKTGDFEKISRIPEIPDRLPDPITILNKEVVQWATESSKEKRISVLSLANAFAPGGGYLKDSAQEERLFEGSDVAFRTFAKYPRRQGDFPGLSQMGYAYAVEGVQNYELKEDQAMPVGSPYHMIFAAAPSFSKRHDVGGKRALYFNQRREEYIRLIALNIRLSCELALAENSEKIGLGALGCGAFANNPFLVAAIFRLVLAEDRYEKLNPEFLIFNPNAPDKKSQLAQTFEAVFNCTVEQLKLIMAEASPYDEKIVIKEQKNIDFNEYILTLKNKFPQPLRLLTALLGNKLNTTDDLKTIQTEKDIKVFNAYNTDKYKIKIDYLSPTYEETTDTDLKKDPQFIHFCQKFLELCLQKNPKMSEDIHTYFKNLRGGSSKESKQNRGLDVLMTVCAQYDVSLCEDNEELSKTFKNNVALFMNKKSYYSRGIFNDFNFFGFFNHKHDQKRNELIIKVNPPKPPL